MSPSDIRRQQGTIPDQPVPERRVAEGSDATGN